MFCFLNLRECQTMTEKSGENLSESSSFRTGKIINRNFAAVIEHEVLIDCSSLRNLRLEASQVERFDLTL